MYVFFATLLFGMSTGMFCPFLGFIFIVFFVRSAKYIYLRIKMFVTLFVFFIFVVFFFVGRDAGMDVDSSEKL